MPALSRGVWFVLGFGMVLVANEHVVSQQPKKGEVVVGKIRTYIGHDAPVRGVGFSLDDKKIYSSSDDKTIRIWDATADKKGVVFAETKLPPGSLFVFPKPAKMLVHGSEKDNFFYTWDLVQKRTVRSFSGHGYGTADLMPSLDGKWIVHGAGDGKMRIFDVNTGAILKDFDAKQGVVEAVAISSDSKRVACSSDDDGSLRVFNSNTGKLIVKLRNKERNSKVSCLRFIKSGKELVASYNNGELVHWDVDGEREIGVIPAHKERINALDIHNNSEWVLTGSNDKTVKLSSLDTKQVLETFEGHEKEVYCVSFSNDGKKAVSGGKDESVRLWGLPAK